MSGSAVPSFTPQREARTLREHGFTLVEVIIAALLLTAIISGLALAVSSGMRAQSAAKSSKSLHAVTLRVFEHVRSERGWMDSCTKPSIRPAMISGNGGSNTPDAGDGCTLTIPGRLLEDSSAGPSCSPSGGTYQHRLQMARATPVDSPVDGTGTADRDQKLPDYYTIRIEVAAADCAKGRLGGPAPAVFEGSVDRSGNVPDGSLEIEVCAAVNQVDERMSIAGCSGTQGDAVEMLKCPPAASLWAGTPAASCGAVHALTNGRSHNVDFSPSVSLARATATFEIVNAAGAVVTTSARKLPGTPAGIYRFTSVPAGTYFLRKIVPGGAAAGMRPWESKMIPAGDAGGAQLGLVVQPDVRSRGLVMFAPKDVGSLNLRFKRQVTIHDVHTVNSGMRTATAHIPTTDFQGDKAAIEKYRDLLKGAAKLWRIECNSRNITCDIKMYNQKEGANCWKIGDKGTVKDEEGITHSWDDVGTVCSFYDFNVDFRYEAVRLVGRPIRAGAPTGGTYSAIAQPTYRHVVPASSQAQQSCVGIAGSKLGLRVLAPTGGCVAARTTPNTVRLGPFTPGLQSGVLPFSRSVPSGASFLNDGGGVWTTARNESVQPIPGGLRRGMWVRRDGSITAADGTRYAPGSTVDVIGRGECLWTYHGGGERIGSCNPCNPYIPGLGNAGTCYVLRNVTIERRLFCESTGGDKLFPCDGVKRESIPQVKFCSGPPAVGSYIKTAPNCHSAPPSAPSVGGGASGGGGNSNAGYITSPTGSGGYGGTAIAD